MMDEFEAYTAPAEDVQDPPAPLPDEQNEEAPRSEEEPSDERTKALRNAIKRLNEHLATPQLVADDEAARKEILRPATKGFLGFAVVMGLGTLFWTTQRSNAPQNVFSVLAIVVSVIFGAVAFAAVLSDVLSAPGKRSTTPLESMNEFLRAVRLSRYGQAWSILSPTARESHVSTPNLGILPVIKTEKQLRTPREFQQYITSFLHSATGNHLRILHLALVEQTDEVATCEVRLEFRKFTIWPIAFTFLLAYISWYLVLLGIVVVLAMGSRIHRVPFHKTLIRGSNGAWYMYSGDFIETVITLPSNKG